MSTDQIDEFQSIFRRAEREPFLFESININRVSLVTDGGTDAAEDLKTSLLEYFPGLQNCKMWSVHTGDSFSNVQELLELLDTDRSDLIITHRHLQEKSLVPQHSLGVCVDVLTQISKVPVLLLPGTASEPKPLSGKVCREVMVVTNHISSESQLINYGVTFCPQDGEIWLSHVEDDAVFERIIQTFERIPEIDSELVRELLGQQLQKEAEDFINTCADGLKEKVPGLTVKSDVTRGHHLKVYQRLIQNHDIDLLITNTKDDEQLAMHGMAYSISVELIDVPLLLL